MDRVIGILCLDTEQVKVVKDPTTASMYTGVARSKIIKLLSESNPVHFQQVDNHIFYFYYFDNKFIKLTLDADKTVSKEFISPRDVCNFLNITIGKYYSCYKDNVVYDSLGRKWNLIIDKRGAVE